MGRQEGLHTEPCARRETRVAIRVDAGLPRDRHDPAADVRVEASRSHPEGDVGDRAPVPEVERPVAEEVVDREVAQAPAGVTEYLAAARRQERGLRAGDL